MVQRTKDGRKKPKRPTPAQFSDEYIFDDRGRPPGGLWLPVDAVAESFGVTSSAVQAWRREASWQQRFEAAVRGKLMLNVVQVCFWRFDKARAAGRNIRSVHFELCDRYEERGVFLPAGRRGG